jgi:hypothetical protein
MTGTSQSSAVRNSQAAAVAVAEGGAVAVVAASEGAPVRALVLAAKREKARELAIPSASPSSAAPAAQDGARRDRALMGAPAPVRSGMAGRGGANINL